MSVIWDKYSTTLNPLANPDVEFMGYWLKGRFSDGAKRKDVLAESFEFKLGEVPHTLDTILVGSVTTSDLDGEWVVHGLKSVVGAYIGYMKYLQRRGFFSELDAKRI